MFTPKQRNRLRGEFRKAHDRAKIEEKKWYWTSICGRIEEYFEFRMPDVERQSLPKPYCDLKKIDLGRADNFGSRFYKGKHEEKEEKFVAVYCWLISPDCKWSTLTKEQLFGLSHAPRAAEYLANFLHENVEDRSELSPDQFSAQYRFENDSTRLELNVGQTISENILDVTIQETRFFKTPGGGRDINFFTHTGWIVLAPNSSIFCILNNREEEYNHLYIPIGINDLDWCKKEPISDILFLDQPDYYQFSELEFEKSEYDLLKLWSSKNTDKIIVFHRVV